MIEEIHDRSVTDPLITELIDKITENNKIVDALDAGCGEGRYSIYLANKGVNVTAVDKCKSSVNLLLRKICKERILNINAHNIGISSIKYINKKFDLILDIGMMHFLSEIQLQEYMNSLKKIVSKNGYFILNAFAEKERENNPNIKASCFLESEIITMLNNIGFKLLILDLVKMNQVNHFHYMYVGLFQKKEKNE